jgi:hypothetical protein
MAMSAKMWTPTIAILASLALLPPPAIGNEILGLGADPGFPPCANSCARTLAQVPISCSSDQTDGNFGLAAHVVTTPQCYATDTPYLTTLAWCIHEKCAAKNLTDEELDYFWNGPVSSNLLDAVIMKAEDYAKVPVSPGSGVDDSPLLAKIKWGYYETLSQISEPPTRPLNKSVVLNYTAEVLEIQWLFEFNSDTSGIAVAVEQARYG